MSVSTSAGSTFGISATLPATETAGGYQALTFTTIGEISDLGQFGLTFAEVTFQPLATRTKQKFKGSKDAGTVALKMGKNISDAGQIALKAALASDNAYAFVATLQSGTQIFFQGRVMSLTTMVGTTDQITGADCNISITTDPIEV